MSEDVRAVALVAGAAIVWGGCWLASTLLGVAVACLERWAARRGLRR